MGPISPRLREPAKSARFSFFRPRLPRNPAFRSTFLIRLAENFSQAELLCAADDSGFDRPRGPVFGA